MEYPVHLTLASGGHPLLDLDYTFVFQLVIFATTFFVAKAMLFRPYLRMKDDRFAGIEGAQKEAIEMSSRADAQLVDYEAKLESARKRAQDERHKLRSEAAKHHADVTESARADSVKAFDSARAKVETESSAARSVLIPKADELGRQIATRLLGREVAS